MAFVRVLELMLVNMKAYQLGEEAGNDHTRRDDATCIIGM